MDLNATVIIGDNRRTLAHLPEKFVQTVVTSPPYFGLRDYGEDDQIGLESTPQDFIEQLCKVFDEVWRVLKDDGTLWVNLGDSYYPHGGSRGNKTPAGDSLRGRDNEYQPAPKFNTGDTNLKQKDLIGIPWRFAFAMQDRGWYLRSDIIWHKPNPMPESVTDRPTKSHEYIFLLTKLPKYYYDHEAIKEQALTEPSLRDKNAEGYQADYVKGDRFSEGARVYGADGMKNKRDVWSVPVRSYKEAHFATYPTELISPCILAGSKEGDTILDPFSGSGTTGEVALKNNRHYIGLELNPEYAKLSEKRLSQAIGMFGNVTVKGTDE